MVLGKKKLVLCLISIGCLLLLCLTAAWYAFCLKHVHLPDSIRIPSEVLKESFTGKIQDYKGTQHIYCGISPNEALRIFKKNGFKAACLGSLANHKDGGIREEDIQSGNEDYLVLADGAYMINEIWELRHDSEKKIFPHYWYEAQIFYKKNDVLIVMHIACNDPRKPEFKLLLDEIAAYFNDYIEQQNALLMG
jgi:hypothetical protein